MKKPDLSTVYGVILAGGRSSRLFPFNKVLSDLTGTGQSLLQQAVNRTSERLKREPFRDFIARDHVYVLTAAPMVAPMREQLGLPASRFLVDPVRRGTWPALLWAMAHLRQNSPKATLAVLTADHVIPNTAQFRKAVSEALQLAQEEETIALIGVTPSAKAEEWTGFGTFRGGNEVVSSGHPITAFEEKPSLERAQVMAREGDWFWNAGMFFFRIAVAEAVLKRFQPEMYEIYLTLCAAIAKKDRARATEIFSQFPGKVPHPLRPGQEVDNTMDYAVLTPLVHGKLKGLGATVAKTPLEDWRDVGQWPALREIVTPDADGNVSVGRVALSESRDCIVAADHGSGVEAIGTHGYILAVSGGQALVIRENLVGRLKELAAQLAAAPDSPRLEVDCKDCSVQVSNGQILVVGAKDLTIRFSAGRLQVQAAS